jgi:hypothetical protein
LNDSKPNLRLGAAGRLTGALHVPGQPSTAEPKLRQALRAVSARDAGAEAGRQPKEPRPGTLAIRAHRAAMDALRPGVPAPPPRLARELASATERHGLAGDASQAAARAGERAAGREAGAGELALSSAARAAAGPLQRVGARFAPGVPVPIAVLGTASFVGDLLDRHNPMSTRVLAGACAIAAAEAATNVPIVAPLAAGELPATGLRDLPYARLNTPQRKPPALDLPNVQLSPPL